MRSMCARHSGLRGDRGGECVASSTAVDNTSICRPATAGMPNLACTISPCVREAPLPRAAFKRANVAMPAALYNQHGNTRACPRRGTVIPQPLRPQHLAWVR